MHLTDCFEWDLQSDVTPEQFAEIYAADLGLNGEFKTAITHDMREQIQVHLRSLALIGYPFDGSSITDPDLAADFLPTLQEVIRSDDKVISTHTPFLTSVTEMDLLNFEKDRDRDKDKKKKRGTRGRRLVALPDRDPIKTNRSRISGGKDETGMAIPLAAIPKEPLPAARVTPQRAKVGSRRAAAIAAKASITTMTSDLAHEGIISTGSSPDRVLPKPHALHSRRNRVMTTSPEPDSALQSVPSPTGSRVKQEAPQQEKGWVCSNCHRSENTLQNKTKVNGPPEKPDLCFECGEL